MRKFINNAKKFLKEVWQEVNPKTGKVSWPDKKAWKSSTIIVLVIIIIFSVYTAALDAIFLFVIELFSK